MSVNKYQLEEDFSANPNIKNFNVRFEDQIICLVRIQLKDNDMIYAHEYYRSDTRYVSQIFSKKNKITLDIIQDFLESKPPEYFMDYVPPKKEKTYKIVITTELLNSYVVGNDDRLHGMTDNKPDHETFDDIKEFKQLEDAKIYVDRAKHQVKWNKEMSHTGDMVRSIYYKEFDEPTITFKETYNRV